MKNHKNRLEGSKKGQFHDTITLMTLLKVIYSDVSCNFKKFQGFSRPISDIFERIAPMTPQQLGGRAVAKKHPPAYCPRCGKEIEWTATWHSYLGHLGLHGLADKYFNGDIEAAQKRLRENGIARQEEGATWSNGAFKPYHPVMEQ